MSKPIPIKSAYELLKKEDYERISPLEKETKLFKKQSDPRFGDIFIFQHQKSKGYLAVKEIITNDQKNAAELIINARNRVLQQHPHLLSLIDYSVTKKAELCSSNYIIKYFFDYPHSDLLKEDVERLKNNSALSHAELLHYFYHQLMALQFLESLGRFHGDVRPILISINKLEIHSKLVDKSEQLGNKEKVKQLQRQYLIQNEAVYQSSELYNNLKKNNLKFDFDANKEDVYALGLSILQIGNQSSIQNIYDSSKGAFNQQNLDEHIQRFQNKFSGQNTLLVSAVQEALKANVSERPNAAQLLSKMPDYKVVQSYLQNQGVGGNNLLNNGLSLGVVGGPQKIVNVSSSVSNEWKSDIKHEYIRMDKSVERPTVVPYKDANSKVLIHENPFTNDSSIHVQKSPSNVNVRANVIPKSIENPNKILYLGPNKDLNNNTETYLNNNYKNYLGQQNEVVIERIHHKYIGPGQYEIQKNVNILKSDGSTVEVKQEVLETPKEENKELIVANQEENKDKKESIVISNKKSEEIEAPAKKSVEPKKTSIAEPQKRGSIDKGNKNSEPPVVKKDSILSQIPGDGKKNSIVDNGKQSLSGTRSPNTSVPKKP